MKAGEPKLEPLSKSNAAAVDAAIGELKQMQKDGHGADRRPLTPGQAANLKKAIDHLDNLRARSGLDNQAHFGEHDAVVGRNGNDYLTGFASKDKIGLSKPVMERLRQLDDPKHPRQTAEYLLRQSLASLLGRGVQDADELSMRLFGQASPLQRTLRAVGQEEFTRRKARPGAEPPTGPSHWGRWIRGTAMVTSYMLLVLSGGFGVISAGIRVLQPASVNPPIFKPQLETPNATGALAFLRDFWRQTSPLTPWSFRSVLTHTGWTPNDLTAEKN